MSLSNDRFGYGIDIGLTFSDEGQIDLLIDETGDIGLIGGDGDSSITQKVQNVFQQIKIRLSTPFKSLKDENNIATDIGSELHKLIGAKRTEMNVMLIKSYILNSLIDLQFFEAIYDIKLILDDRTDANIIYTQIVFKLKFDDNQYFTTVSLN